MAHKFASSAASADTDGYVFEKDCSKVVVDHDFTKKVRNHCEDLFDTSFGDDGVLSFGNDEKGLQIVSAPFKTTKAQGKFGLYDRFKFLGLYKKKVGLKDGWVTHFHATMSGKQILEKAKIPEAYKDRIVDKDLDYRLAHSAFVVLDKANWMLYSFVFTNKGVYVCYESLPFGRADWGWDDCESSSSESCSKAPYCETATEGEILCKDKYIVKTETCECADASSSSESSECLKCGKVIHNHYYLGGKVEEKVVKPCPIKKSCEKVCPVTGKVGVCLKEKVVYDKVKGAYVVPAEYAAEVVEEAVPCTSGKCCGYDCDAFCYGNGVVEDSSYTRNEDYYHKHNCVKYGNGRKDKCGVLDEEDCDVKKYDKSKCYYWDEKKCQYYYLDCDGYRVYVDPCREFFYFFDARYNCYRRRCSQYRDCDCTEHYEEPSVEEEVTYDCNHYEVQRKCVRDYYAKGSDKCLEEEKINYAAYVHCELVKKWSYDCKAGDKYASCSSSSSSSCSSSSSSSSCSSYVEELAYDNYHKYTIVFDPAGDKIIWRIDDCDVFAIDGVAGCSVGDAKGCAVNLGGEGREIDLETSKLQAGFLHGTMLDAAILDKSMIKYGRSYSALAALMAPEKYYGVIKNKYGGYDKYYEGMFALDHPEAVDRLFCQGAASSILSLKIEHHKLAKAKKEKCCKLVPIEKECKKEYKKEKYCKLVPVEKEYDASSSSSSSSSSEVCKVVKKVSKGYKYADKHADKVGKYVKKGHYDYVEDVEEESIEIDFDAIFKEYADLWNGDVKKVAEIFAKAEFRVSIIDKDGYLEYDNKLNKKALAKAGCHKDRQEFLKACEYKGKIVVVRKSATMHAYYMYWAKAIVYKGKIVKVVRLAKELSVEEFSAYRSAYGA